MATNIKFTGLASGMDTESIVKAMVMPYKNKVDNSKKQQTLLDWKKDAYKEVSNKLYNFYTKTAGTLRLESTFNKKTITASSDSAISIDKNNSTVPSGTHKIDVIDVAEAAMLQTQAIKQPDSNKDLVIDKNTKLTDLGLKVGEKITIKNGDKTEEIEITEDHTISKLQSEFKEKLPDFNVNFDENAKAFFISSKQTGKLANEITLTGSTENTLSALGLATSGTSEAKFTQGVDAKYTYNNVEMTSASNKVSVNGLSFTIKDTTKVSGTVIISSIDDIDGMVDTIKSFVDEYNKLIEELNGLINAPSAKGYEPLTDEEKEAMSDKEIEQWEAKIKGGLLRNDPVLKDMLTSMRSAIGGTFPGNTFGSLSGIGITTGSYNENGKLYIDEEKLKAALNKDPDAVVELLAGSKDPQKNYETLNPGKKYEDLPATEKKSWESKNVGMFDRLYDNLKGKFSAISNVKTSTSLYNDLLWNKKITNQATETDKWQERLEKMETMYYNKFTAMEKLMSTMNAQSSSLTSLFGGTQ